MTSTPRLQVKWHTPLLGSQPAVWPGCGHLRTHTVRDRDHLLGVAWLWSPGGHTRSGTGTTLVWPGCGHLEDTHGQGQGPPWSGLAVVTWRTHTVRDRDHLGLAWLWSHGGHTRSGTGTTLVWGYGVLLESGWRGFHPHCGRGCLSGWSHATDFTIGTPTATLPGAWHLVGLVSVTE